MKEGGSTVKDSWARSIKLKELEEELGKLRTESWSLISAERFDEALALRRRAENLERDIEGVKADEAKAREMARAVKAAALASKGIVAIPSKGDRILELHEELEQARAAGDFDRAVEVRRGILAIQDSDSKSSGSAAPSAMRALPAPDKPLAIADAAVDPDFDPRVSEGAEFVVPVPKRRIKPVTSETGLSGRAAERYTAMRAELQQAVESKDEAVEADVRRRLEIFRAEFMDKKDEIRNPAEPEPRQRRQGRKGAGKGRGKARDEQVEQAEAERPLLGKGRAKAKPKPAAVAARPEPARSVALSADQLRAKKQVEAWREEVELLEQGLMDYRGDEDCKQAVDLRQRRDDMNSQIRDLVEAAATDGPALQAALRAIDQASNPDTREAQLAALAKLSKVLHKG